MKKIVILLALASGYAGANDIYHQGYTRSNGTYVQPHYQTAPDNSVLNNYSTQGNVNPYTGQAGTVNPYQAPQIQAPIISPQPAYPAYGQQRSRY